MFRNWDGLIEEMDSVFEEAVNAFGKVSNGTEKVSNGFERYLALFDDAETTATFVANIKKVFDQCGTTEVFRQADIMCWLDCSKSKATNVMNAMKAAKVIEKVAGIGPGRYKFIEK